MVVPTVSTTASKAERTGFVFGGALAGLMALHLATGLLSTEAATMAACGAILLFGLPHGTLDLELIKLERSAGAARMSGILALYLGLAGVMYMMWQVAPVAALIAFIVIAVIHFAEDWEAAGSAFLAQGIALALLTAPAFGHRVELAGLFVALSGVSEAAVVADIMLLLAPVSLAVAAVAFAAMWQAGQGRLAVSGVGAVLGLALLPPAVGFALFFCLLHSPRHFGAALALLAPVIRGRWLRVVAPLTLAALGIAAVLFGLEARADTASRIVAASFMTLSILTVPHMLVPVVLRRVSQRSAKGDRRVGAH